jgi:drug/metabolite transporter (DMT)-like permease
MSSSDESGGTRLLFETIAAIVFAIALGALATWLSDVALDPRRRTALAFYILLLPPLAFVCVAVFRLRRHGESAASIALALLVGLLVTGLGSGIVDRLIDCHFGNCTNIIDG